MTPRFADGISAPRIAHSGNSLPLARVVSQTMHPDEGYHDHAGTVMVIAWGQFMDHDYTLTATPLGLYFICVTITLTIQFVLYKNNTNNMIFSTIKESFFFQEI